MKNLKKLVSVVLSLAMVISMMTFTASAKTYGDVESTSKYAEAVDILSSLGILQGDENGNFNGDAEIKRSEFAAVVCRALGQENAAEGSATEQRFTDVASNHWAAGYINWAAGQKIVNGKGDGIFDPDAPVKYEEAVKMLVVALGYEPLAARKGGYPTGYMVVAASNGINSGVSLAGSANAPRYIVAQLTYNALDVPLMDSSYVSVNGQDEYNVYDGTDYARRTILSYYLDVAKVKATVDKTAVQSDKLLDKDGSEKVTLTLTNAYKFDWDDILDGQYEKGDDDDFYVGTTNAADYFGYTVIAYIGENEDGDWEIFAITGDAKSAETLEVTDGFEIADYAKAQFEYYENEDDLRTQEVDLKASFKVYMNGYELSASSDPTAERAFEAIPDYASKVVFMGDKGDDYDKVFITQYAYALVDEVVAEDGYIKFKESSSDNTLTLDADDRNNSKFTYTLKDENGTILSLEDIEENDVLNILCAMPGAIEDKDINTMEIIVTKASVEGTVDEEVEAGETYGIDGVEYDLVKGAPVTLEVGDAGKYFLTIDGKIFAEDEDYEADEVSGKNYGFISKVGSETKFGENTWQVKLFTKDGALTTYDVADTLYLYETAKSAKQTLKKSKGEQDTYFNKVTGYVADQDDSDDVLTNIENRVISYKLNASGEIKEIKTGAYIGSTKDNATYRANSEKFMGKTFTAKSVLFNAPVDEITTTSGKVYNVDEDDIEVLSFSALDEDITYNNSFVFDLNSKKEIGLAVVTEGVEASKTSAMAVVTGISTVLNDQKAIKFFQNGEFKTYAVSDNCDDLDDLEVGDIFQYTLSGDEISKATIVYDYNAVKEDGNAAVGKIVTKDSGDITYAMGVVKEVEGKYVTTDKGDFDFANSSLVGTVALYNTERAAKNAVTKLSGLSSMKDSSKNTYVVVVRMDDKEVVDAIEYQYDSDVYEALTK